MPLSKVRGRPTQEETQRYPKGSRPKEESLQGKRPMHRGSSRNGQTKGEYQFDTDKSN